MRPLAMLLVALLSADVAAQCSTGSCGTSSRQSRPLLPGPLPEPQLRASGYVGENPTPEQLTAAGFVRITRPDGTAYWAQPKPGVAADARGRTYAVPVRSAVRAAGDWVAAPRLRALPQQGGEQQACESCESEGSDLPDELPTDLPPPPENTTAPGPQGPAGPKGDKGDPGEVDYDRLQGMIAQVVGQSLQQMQPELEEAIVERIAADPRFRGPKGDAGKLDVRELSDAELEALANKIAAKLPGMTFKKINADGSVGDTETVPLGGTLLITGKLLEAR